MNRPVVIRAKAQRDVQKACVWYDEQRPGLGDEFEAEVMAVFEQLESSVDRTPIHYRGLRRAFVERFPYKVFYRSDADGVIVFRVLHSAQDHTAELD